MNEPKQPVFPEGETSNEQEVLKTLGCTKEEVAHLSNEINEQTKVFIGKLEPGIFNKIQQNNIEHVFTEYPEGKLTRIDLEIGGVTGRKVMEELSQKTDASRAYSDGNYLLFDMIKADVQWPAQPENFKKEKENLNLISVRVCDLFNDKEWHPLDEIYKQAEKLGLKLVPGVVGPHLRLNYLDQPENERLHIGMHPRYISGVQDIFTLTNEAEKKWDGAVLNEAKPRLLSTLAGDSEHLTGQVTGKNKFVKFSSEEKFVFKLKKVVENE